MEQWRRIVPNKSLQTVGTAKWRQVVPKYLQEPLKIALDALEANDLQRAIYYFGVCFERIPQELDANTVAPEARPIIYFAAQATASAYFARRSGDTSMPWDMIEQWHDVALALCEASWESHPSDAVAAHNLGRFLQDDGDREGAIRMYKRALILDSSQAETWGNIGTALYEQGKVEDAWYHWRKCVSLPTDRASGKLAQAYIHLRDGNFLDGWRCYNERWNDLEFTRGYGRQKEFAGAEHWHGPLPGGLGAGGALLLHGEQGLGDHVQFARYVKLLLDAGYPVIGLETRPILKRWMEASFPMVPVYARGVDHLPPFTHHCSTLDLPGICGTTLETIPEIVAPKLPPVAGGVEWATASPLPPHVRERRVGIAWHGAKANPADAVRSIPDEELRHLADIPGVQWVSLQFGETDAMTAQAWLGAEDGTAGCKDVLDTAAVIRSLDLVITVDTLTAHVAGTLGVPTRILHRFCREWRWGESGETSPWYPSVRNLTQAKPGDWTELLGRVKAELTASAQTSSGSLIPL
jgi:tetratricopeptide (TPR) repeat protein